MIPLRIEVRNFLRYGSRGGEPFVFDFEGAHLWSIAGPNGTGKSALFDAITWTLFGVHRGGKSEDHRLVHHGALVGDAAFEFSLGGQMYRVQRSVSAKTKQTRRQASRRSGTGKWESIEGTDRKPGLDAWVETIGLRYETFIASTVLLQGESDRLILAPPKARFDVLAGALDLRAFELIAKRAQDLARMRSGQADTAASQLAQAPHVLQSDVDEAEDEADQTASALAKAVEERETATLGLAEASRAERLEVDLRAATEQRDEHASALAEADRIRSAHAEWVDLESAIAVLPLAIAELEKADQCTGEADDLDAQIGSSAVAELESAAEESATRAREAAAALLEARAQQAAAASELAASIAELDEVDQCEVLERMIAEAEAEVALLEASHAQAQDIFDALADAELVRDAAPLVEAALEAERARTAREAECERVGSPGAVAAEGEQLRQVLSRAEDHRRLAESTREDAREAEIAASERMAQAKRTLETRRVAADEGRCSHCGQRVPKAHIQKELASAEVELERAQRAAEGTRAAAEAASARLTSARTAVEHAGADVASIEQRHAAAVAADQERVAAALVRAAVNDRIDQAGAVAPVIRELLGLEEPARRKRLEVVKDLPGLADQARLARDRASRAAGRRDQIGRLNEQLIPLREGLTDEARILRRDRHARAVGEHDELRAATEDAAKIQVESEQVRAASAARYAAVLDETVRSRERARAAREAAGKAAARADGLLGSLPEAIHATLSIGAAAVLEACRTRRVQLEGIVAQHAALELASAEHAGLAARVDTLSEQLEQIPLDRRNGSAIWEERRAAAERQLQAVSTRHDTAQAHLRERRRELAEYERLVQADADARRAARLAARLAELVGRTRLQARLMEDALRELARLANEMLNRTSEGQLEVRLSLRATSGDELVEIEALDHASANEPMEVAFLSGGQKFRVAVALAAAIGQYMGGPRAGRSLIVDEGFGSLDEGGRREMISELQRISPEMDRVIVVSHHEDFTSRDLFPSGFIIAGSGRATTVERIV